MEVLGAPRAIRVDTELPLRVKKILLLFFHLTASAFCLRFQVFFMLMVLPLIFVLLTFARLLMGERLYADEGSEWKGPFYFIQGADPQFGLIKNWAEGDSDSGGDEWDQEIQLTRQAVQAINKMMPKPKFFVLCGDLIHAMPGKSTVTDATCFVMDDLGHLHISGEDHVSQLNIF